jgi:hypothetical protein
MGATQQEHHYFEEFTKDLQKHPMSRAAYKIYL